MAYGQVSVSGGTGGTTLCTGGGYATLTPIVISEVGSNNNDIDLPTSSVETLNLTLSDPALEFEPNVGSFSFTGAGASTVIISGNVTATQISISISELDDTNASGLNAITITGVRVRATAGVGSNNLLRPVAGGGSVLINGFAAGANVSAVASYDPPMVDAGSDSQTCEATAFNFSSQSTAASTSSGTNLSWTHNGVGALTNGATLTPTYTPTGGETGVVTFTLTASNSNGSCSSVIDQMQLTINPTTAIVTPPSASVICEDSNTQFTVTATGTGLSFQWKENGSNISDGGVYSGATTSSLSLTNVPSTFNGRTYSLDITGTCGTVTSAPAVVLNVDEKPEIIGQPASQVICQNTNVDFVVDAGVTTGVSYQWQISTDGGLTYNDLADGGIYTGATTGILNLVNVPLVNSGYLYRAKISGVCTPAIISNSALLTVSSTAAITAQPQPLTVCENSAATFSVTATGTGLAYQWRENGTNIANGGIYSGATSATLVLSNAGSALNGNMYDVVITGTCSNVTSAAVALTIQEKPEITSDPSNQIICETGNTTFTVNPGVTTTPAFQWQVSTNGGTSFSNISNGGIYGGATSATLTLTAVPIANNNNLYRTVVSGVCAPPVTSNAALLTVRQNAAITTQPQPVTICENSAATFSVTATGAGLTYQWRENGANITNGGIYSGATSSTLTLSSAGTALNGKAYDVVITGTCSNITSTAATLTIREMPEVTADPSNRIICQGGNTTFTVNAGVTTTPTYQWQVSTNGGTSFSNISNGGVYSGATTATLALTTVPLANNNNLYRAVISGACTPSATSNAGLLTVRQTTTITVQPQPLTICENSAATFSVTAVGAGLTYQWKENGTNITNGGIYSGATSSMLTLSSAGSALNGKTYSVVVTGTCSNATSTTAALTIRENPEVIADPSSQIICEAGNTTFTVNAGVTTTPVYQWQVSTNGGTSFSNVSNGGIYSGATTATLTLTAVPLANNNNLYRAIVSGVCAPPVTSNAALLTVRQVPVIAAQPQPLTICENSLAIFSVTATGTGLTYQWREDGANITNGGIYSGATSSTLTLSSAGSALNGKLYDVVITGTCSNITSSAAALTIQEKPEVTSDPTSQTICETGNTTFTVNAGVTTTPAYQWQVSTNGGTSFSDISNGGIYSGATSAILTLTAVPLANNNNLYRAVVSGVCAPPVTSNAALLTVRQAPVITVQPQPLTICENSVATFSVTATGTGLTYQWRENGTNITNGGIYSGATLSTLTLSSAGTALNGKTYDVVITGTCSNITSSAAALTIQEKPEVTSDPTNQTICETGNTTFTVNAGVTTTPAYQWQVSTNGGTSFSDISNGGIYSGAASAILTLTAVPLANNNNLYRAVVSGVCAPPVTSNAALLTVRQAPVITVQPQPLTICENTGATFSVTATGTGLTYQWRENGTNITNGGIYSGATSATLTLSSAGTALNGKTYDVVITGTCSNITSSSAALNIRENPEVTADPLNQTICAGGNTTFTVNAGVTTTPTYQWQVSTNGGTTFSNVSNGGIYSGATSAALTLTAVPLANNNNLYRAVVSGVCTPPTTSNAALLTVRQNPVITVQPQPLTICENSTATFSVTATGAGLTYQWRENGTNITNGGIYSGATSATLILSNAGSALNGKTYDVVITGTCSNITSSAVALTIREKPEVTADPINQTICESGSTAFTVNAGVTTTPTYQWQVSTDGGSTFSNISNGGIYSGATTATIVLTAVPVGNNNELYRAVISGVCAPPVTSNAALLTVRQNPAITTQPQPLTICENSAAAFSVAATGTGLTYQWRENGVNITNGGVYSGATSATLLISNAGSALNGKTFDVVISGTCSNATSAGALLTIQERPEVVSHPANQTICETGGTTFTVDAGVTTTPTYQWQVSTNGGTSFSDIADGGIYSGATTSTLTLAAVPFANDNNLYRAVVSGVCAPPVISNAALLRVGQAPVITAQPMPSTVCENSAVTFSVTAIGTGLTYQWSENGVDITNGGIYSGATSATLTISSAGSALNGNTYDVMIMGTCSNVSSTGVVLTIQEKPEVISDPANQTICETGSTTFTVDAGVTTAPTYQWQVSANGGTSFSNIVDGGIYNGATTATLTLTGVPLIDNNDLYRAVISGTCTPTATSNAALLTVRQNPVITTQPQPLTICENSGATFSVTATGTGLTYQWRENGTNITNGGIYSGATSATLVLSSAGSALNGKTYDVVITGTCSNITSTAATLTIHEMPEVTADPSNRVICQGGNTTFTVNAGVTTTPAYQWQVSTNGGTSFSNISNGGIYSGATTATLTLTAVPLANNNNLYRAVISGVCTPSATSNAALLTVRQNPVISVQPQPSTICENSSTAFSVTASGAGLTFQWRENGTNISNGGIYSGATSATLVLTSVPSTLNGKKYDVVISGTCAATTSSQVTLTVNRNPNAFAADATICSGQTTGIAITNPNAVAGVSFAWTVQSASNVSGASSGVGPLIAQNLTVTDGVNPGTVTYLITASAAGCSGAPYAVNVVVKPIPTVAASPQTICSGSSSSVVITNPNGVAGTTFSWIVQSSSNVTGATAGSGSVISQLLTSTDGIAQGTVTYRITPAAGACSGNFVDVTVTVNPVPILTNPTTSLIQEICSNTPLNFVPTASVTGSTFTWTSSVIGTLSGVSATGSGPITDTPVNATNTNAVIIYSITPKATGCSGPTVNYVVTVRPVPTAAAVPQSICSGQTTSVAITNPNSVVGTTFTWTVFSSTNATGATSGSGATISQLLTSTDGVSAGSVTYAITPSANGCSGPSSNVTVSIKSVPVITNVPSSLSQQICSATPLSFVPTASVSGSTFTWTSTITGSITPGSVTASGSGNITDAPVNTGSVLGKVTYHIIAQNNSCNGPAVDFIVTVQPVPSATAPNVTICSGDIAIVSINNAPKNVAGTTFSWNANPSANVTGAANGNGSTITQQLSTTNASVGTVGYSITPSANGCSGTPVLATVTVNPQASVNAGADFQVCESASMPMAVPVTGKIGGAATSATWFIKTGSGTVGASTTSGVNVSTTYTAVNADVVRGYVDLYIVTNDPDGAGQPCAQKADTIRILVNKRATIIPAPDQLVCEPAQINLVGKLSGSATAGSWSVIASAGGTLSVSSLTGTNVSATYDTLAGDVGTTLVFRLTSNDPDGSGPCVAATDDVNVQINRAAKVNAGADFEVCEDKVVNLNGSFKPSATSVTWSGGSGAAQFSNVNNPLSKYNLTAADISAGSITLTLTTNDPDAGGPCAAVSDAVMVRINPLPFVDFFGLKTTYAENYGVETLHPVPTNGVFTGPGIVAGTFDFKTANAGYGTVVITYTATNAKGCTNFAQHSTIVNPVTSVDFYIKDNPRDANGFPEICADQGDVTLVGIPDVDQPHLEPTKFVAISPELTSKLKVIGGKYQLNTDSLKEKTYQLQYIFTNTFNATDTITKDIIVHASPKSIITKGNNCIDATAVFHNASFIPDVTSTDHIDKWIWLYGEGNNGNTASDTTILPTYNYLAPGTKTVSLQVVTSNNCSNTSFKTIVVGTPPSPDFKWSAYCQGDTTKFEDNSTSTFGTVNSHAWDFGDGNSLTMSPSNTPVPPGTHGGATGGIWMDPTHKYTNYQSYDVQLTVGTTAGCTATKTKSIFILQTPVTAGNYSEDFANGPGTWVAVADPDNGSGNSSWIFGKPYGHIIDDAASTPNAWWTGGNDTTYYANEQSFVYGPCLNLTSIDRPMVSLNYQVDTKEGFDGAVIQYSTDGGLNWRSVGNAEEDQGINWYNKRDIVGKPGGFNNYAWSEEGVAQWRNARFNLDQIPVQERDTVIFRVAFGSSLDRPLTKLDGFAFDDIYIGTKRRNVLVEHFTNDDIALNNQIDDVLDNLNSKDYIPLQYHLSGDDINKDNPIDPLARAVLYSVSMPPATFMDGLYGQYYTTDFNGLYSKITPQVLDRRSLEDPSFDITMNFPATVTKDTLAINLTYTYNDTATSYTKPVILQAALVESNVNGNKYVLRKLLLGREGFVIESGLTADVPQTFNQQKRIPIDVPLLDTANLWIVAFAQEITDAKTKKVLQSVIVKAPGKIHTGPVGIEKNVEVYAIEVYPNPASATLNFKLEQKLSAAYEYKLIDQRGVTVLNGTVNRDLRQAQQIDISNLANGIYFLAIQGKGKAIRYEKIAVMNEH